MASHSEGHGEAPVDATGDDALHAAAEAGGKVHAEGMPQLDVLTFPNQIFWTVVALGVIYYMLSRIALPRIGTILEERHNAIAADLDHAAELRQKATEAEAAYEKALADARAEAGRIADETKATIQAEMAAAMAEADEKIAAQTEASTARIAEIRDSARANVEAVSKDTARALVSALLPGAEDGDAIDAAIARRMGG